MAFTYRSILPFVALVPLLLSGCMATVPTSPNPETASVAPIEGDDAWRIDDIETVDATIKLEQAVQRLRQLDHQKTLAEEIAADPAFNNPDNLWHRIRSGFTLQQIEHSRIESELQRHLSHPKYLANVQQRARPYLYHIVEQVEARKLPLELALLPAIESAFKPFAYSHAGASGLWQFMPATGRGFGLKQTSRYDGRRDVIAATDAALDYLEQLYDQFDSWPLALAAYNCGPGNLGKAIQRNRAAGKPTDYWSLSLPRETKDYVPRLLAFSRLIAHPASYDLSLAPIPNQPYFSTVAVKKPLDLRVAAKLAGLSVKELKQLNPAYKGWVVPKGSHQLIIPGEQSSGFHQKLAQLAPSQRLIESKRKSVRYRVKRGDSLGILAKRYGTTIHAIKRTNKLRGSQIQVGQRLTIPTSRSGFTQVAARTSSKSRTKTHWHRVKRGDTLSQIAQRYGTQMSTIKRTNRLRSNQVMVGQKLKILSTKQVASRSKTRHHQVKRGDNLSLIAKRYGTSIDAIKRANGLKTSKVLVGQNLRIPGSS